LTEFSKISDQDLLAGLTTPRTARITLTTYRQLTRVAQASVEELKQLYRVDHAVRIKTALELGLRMQREVLPPRPLLDTPQSIADLLRPECRGLCEEHFWVISLNARMELVGCEDIAKGALNTVTPAMREIFRSAVVHRPARLWRRIIIPQVDRTQATPISRPPDASSAAVKR